MEKHKEDVSKRDSLGRLGHCVDAQTSVSFRLKKKTLSLFPFKTLHIDQPCRRVLTHRLLGAEDELEEMPGDIIALEILMRSNEHGYFAGKRHLFYVVCHVRNIYTPLSSLKGFSSSPHGSLLYLGYIVKNKKQYRCIAQNSI